MRERGRKLFLSFLDFICYIYETNMCLFIIFQRNLGPPRTFATSRIVLFEVLVIGFQPSTSNVKKICVLDIVWVLSTSLYSLSKFS